MLKHINKNTCTFTFKICFTVLILISKISDSNGQSENISSFIGVLNAIDSIESYKSNEECTLFIDSLRKANNLSTDQQSYINIIIGKHFAFRKEDSLALSALDKARSYLKKSNDTIGSSYAQLLEAYGNLQDHKSNYAIAADYYLQSKNIKSLAIGESNPRYANNLSKIATTYLNTKQFEKAKTYLIETVDIQKLMLGEKHVLHRTNLSNLGIVYQKLGEYDNAEHALIEAKNIIKDNQGRQNFDYLNAINLMAELYIDIGWYDKVEDLYLEAKNITKALVGKMHIKYSSSINRLAQHYYRMGGYKKAIPLYLESKDIRKKLVGTDHPDYAVSLNNIAVLYEIIGEFEKAETLYIESKNIRKRALGEEHLSYSTSLINLASFYHTIGQYEKAEQLYIESKTLRQGQLGPTDKGYTSSLNNLANLYQETDRYDEAEKLFLEFRDTSKKNYGEQHPIYAQSINNLANLYAEMGLYEKAESLYIKSKKIRKEKLGDNHPDYAVSLNNLAKLYKDIGKYDQAESFYLQSKTIQKETYGEEHPDYGIILNNITELYAITNQYEKAAATIIESNAISKKMLNAAFDFLSENEKIKFHDRITNTSSLLKSIGLKYDSKQIKDEIFNTLLFEKGLHLKSNIQTKAFIQSGENTAAIKTYNKLISIKKELYNQLQKPSSERKNIKELENELDQIEKTMARISSSYRKKQEANNVTYEDIASNLKQGEKAIEFTHFTNAEDTTSYAACIIDHTGHIDFVSITEEKMLSKKLKLNGESNSNFINNIYGNPERGAIVKEELLPSLYEIIWEPIEPYLTGSNKIYFSPSGLLNKLNINAIAIDEEYVLADRYDFIELMSTRDIIENQENKTSKDAYLVGGVEYDLSMKENISTDEKHSQRGQPWNYLKWTLTESQNINELFANANYKVIYKSKNEATEDNFKSIGTNAKSPDIIHLSTHGYFFPDPNKRTDTTSINKFSQSKQPLLRSGLILAGGNHSWLGGIIESEKEDGILTAYEISNMDLSDTELVVLSACETGLGDIEGSEGVYGLQRSFKIAGAKYLIMSLWQVPDRATSVFMTRFYENYLEEKLSIREAFNKTQLEMRDRFFDPYNWAGFVLIE